MIKLRKWVINADDFGYSKAVNYGIIEAHRDGVVTSATLMVNMQGARHGAQLAKEFENLGVGIHFVLTCGKPIRADVTSLVKGDGTFHSISEIEKFASLEDVEKELISQMELFYSYGLKPTHIDSHHHVHALEKFYPIFRKVAQKYNLPIRASGNDDRDFQPIEYFCREFYGNHLTVEGTLMLFESLLNYKTVEVMTHPAFIDTALIIGSSYTKERLKELDILTDRRILSFIKDHGIQLVSYKGLDS
jgi:predicted glycoside hydrolase/deacetylase ChbG (UPF0249 family)